MMQEPAQILIRANEGATRNNGQAIARRVLVAGSYFVGDKVVLMGRRNNRRYAVAFYAEPNFICHACKSPLSFDLSARFVNGEVDKQDWRSSLYGNESSRYAGQE